MNTLTLEPLQIKMNCASAHDIELFLLKHKHVFNPAFDKVVNISEYAQKLRNYGNSYELWFENRLDALMVVYFSEKLKQIYVPYICTSNSHYGPHVGQYLFNLISYFSSPFHHIRLEVRKDNYRALSFYEKLGFSKMEESENKIKMEKKLNFYS